MAEQVYIELEALEKRRDAFMSGMTPQMADAAIAKDLEEYDAGKFVNGVDTVVPAERAKYEAGRRQIYDDMRRAEAEALQRDYAALHEIIATSTASFQRPPKEDNLGLDVMRQLLALQLWQGRPLAAVVKAYRATSDVENPTFVELIETNLEALRLAPDKDTDVEAIQSLKRAIAERKEARIPKEYREALPRSQKVLASVSVSHALQFIKKGGVATRPRPTAVSA